MEDLMSDQNEVARTKNPDGVPLSEITTILKEEGLSEVELLPLDITFGQARGIAGRKRTHVMRRLRDIGFSEGRLGDVRPDAKGTVKIECDIIWDSGGLGLKCHITIQL